MTRALGVVVAAVALVFTAGCNDVCSSAPCSNTGCATVQLQGVCSPAGATCSQCLEDAGYALRLVCVGSLDAGYWSADMCTPP